jgi:hypothetical protein
MDNDSEPASACLTSPALMETEPIATSSTVCSRRNRSLLLGFINYFVNLGEEDLFLPLSLNFTNYFHAFTFIGINGI